MPLYDVRCVRRKTMPNYWKGVMVEGYLVYWACSHKHEDRKDAARCSANEYLTRNTNAQTSSSPGNAGE